MLLKNTIYFFIGLLLLAMAALVHAKFPESPSLLFVVHAPKAEIVKIDNQYKLVLFKPTASYFTDRPLRQAGKMGIEELTQYWNHKKNKVSANLPNAAFVANVDYFKHNHEMTQFAVLKNPQYNKSQLLFSFDLEMLNQKDKSKHLNTGKYENVALFIDNCSDGSDGMGCF
jgi:hypothetical protein